MKEHFDLGVGTAIIAAKYGTVYHNGELELEALEPFDFCDLRARVKLSLSLRRYDGEVEHDDDVFVTGLIKKADGQYARSISWRRQNGEGISDTNIRAEILDLYVKEFLHRGRLMDPSNWGFIPPGSILKDVNLPIAKINTPSVWARLQKWMSRK